MQLQLKSRSQREVQTADGKSHMVDYVSPVRISMLGRECTTGALVIGNQVLLGAIPMEDMDLIVEPASLRVSVNPLSPNIPLSLAKGIESKETPIKSKTMVRYTLRVREPLQGISRSPRVPRVARCIEG